MLKLVFPTQYLVNQLMDFDQTCTEALLQEGSELIRFWWPWPNFQGCESVKTVEISISNAISCKAIDGFWPNLHRSIVGDWDNLPESLFSYAEMSDKHPYPLWGIVILAFHQ